MRDGGQSDPTSLSVSAASELSLRHTLSDTDTSSSAILVSRLQRDAQVRSRGQEDRLSASGLGSPETRGQEDPASGGRKTQ